MHCERSIAHWQSADSRAPRRFQRFMSEVYTYTKLYSKTTRMRTRPGDSNGLILTAKKADSSLSSVSIYTLYSAIAIGLLGRYKNLRAETFYSCHLSPLALWRPSPKRLSISRDSPPKQHRSSGLTCQHPKSRISPFLLPQSIRQRS